MNRPDDVAGMLSYEGRHYGKKGLIVLGGYSAEKWEALRDEIRPDILLIANGANAKIHRADYWLCAENMTRSYNLALAGDKRAAEFFAILNRTGPKVRLVSHRSWHLLKDKRGAVRIRRKSYDIPEIPKDFSIRKYGEGLWGGWLMKDTKAGAKVMVGTVALHLLHLAGILGLSEVHTIGYDLCIKNDASHHWYEYPTYQVDRFRTPEMFVTHLGLKTQVYWVETAQYLQKIEHRFADEGMIWKDHSDGLLQRMGIKAAS